MKLNKTLCFVLALTLVVALLPFSAVATTDYCPELKSTNIGSQNYYFYFATPMESFLSELPDGRLLRFQYESGTEYYVAEFYDSSLNLLSFCRVELELPVFGGFYSSGTNFYVLTGQQNPDELASVECFRVTKYDLSFNRLGSVGLYDCNTTIPFDAGSARFDMCGKYLVIRTAHEMYRSSDGYCHQANVTIEVDTESMTVTDSFTKVMNSAYGYVSHSFNQFVKVENNQLIAVDHGDAYPRSIALIKYGGTVNDGTFASNSCSVYDLLTFPGSIGQNYTGATVGGFEISSDSYLVAYSSVLHDDNYTGNNTRNIFIASMNKSTSAVTSKQITFYAEGSTSPQTPQLVKISDSSFLLMWMCGSTFYYVMLDSDGDPVGEIKTADAKMSDCQPIAVDGNVIWYTYNASTATFYSVSTSDMSLTTVDVTNGHDYTVLSYPTEIGGEADVRCEVCGLTTTVSTPDTFKIWWGEGADCYSYSSAIPAAIEVGDILTLWIPTPDNGADLAVDCKAVGGDIDWLPVKASYGDAGDIRYELTFNETGVYSFEITCRLNPTLKKTYKLRVGDVLMGDVNLSGNVDALDYTLVKRAALGTYAFSDIELNMADVDFDFSINAQDYTLVKRIVLGTYSVD